MADPRIYCQLRDLMLLQQQIAGLKLLPGHRSASVLSGRHGSKLRGRGLNFEELRNYHPGDDIRTLDWRVTLRTGKPHVRAYTEEKDRKVILVIDQRQSLFFSTQDTMKSVIALQLAALCAWRVLADNDRVGAALLQDSGLHWFKPQRSQAQVMQLLRKACSLNQHLQAGPVPSQSHEQLNLLLQKLNRIRLKDATILIFSDWYGWDDASLTLVKALQQHNDVIATLIADPTEKSLPIRTPFIASDGQLQLEVDGQHPQLGNAFQQVFTHKQQQLGQLFKRQNLPVIHINTDGSHLQQFRRAIHGGGP